MKTSTARKGTNLENMKRESLGLLPWLSLEQALVWLKEKFKINMTELDLLSHCIESNCSIYIKASGVEGIYPDGRSHAFSGEVYGVGWQKVLNPEHLKGSHESFSVELLGDVLITPDPQAERIVGIEWNAKINLTLNPLQLKRKDIETLARKINEITGTSTEESLLLTIGALQDLLLDKDFETPKNQEAIKEEVLKRHENNRGLGRRTLENILSEANTRFNKKLNRK